MFTNRSFYLLVVIAVLVVTACAPQVAVTPQATSAQASPAPGAETEGWSEGLLPNGTWTVELSIEDLVGMGVPQSDAPGWAGLLTWTFQDGNGVFRMQGEMDYECEASYEVVEDFVRITYGDSPSNADFCKGVVEDVQWRLADDGLHFHLIAVQNVPFLEDKASYEAKPWQKIEESNPADRFAGTWSGTMSFTDGANRKEDIVVIIPTGCITGSVCGNINNPTISCQWEMTLASLDGDVFTYTFSKTMSGECPALGGGTLTLESDDMLMREHKTPDFTASGPLTRK